MGREAVTKDRTQGEGTAGWDRWLPAAAGTGSGADRILMRRVWTVRGGEGGRL